MIPVWHPPNALALPVTSSNNKSAKPHLSTILQQQQQKQQLPRVVNLIAGSGIDSNSPSTWLPPLASELADLFSRGGLPQHQHPQQQNQPLLGHGANSGERITLLVANDASTAFYAANSLLFLAPAVVSALRLSVPSKKEMSQLHGLVDAEADQVAQLEASGRSKKKNKNKRIERAAAAATATLSRPPVQEYSDLLRTAASARCVSSAKAPCRVVITTVDALQGTASRRGLDLSVFSEGCDIVCMPGVPEEFAGDLQSMTSQMVRVEFATTASNAATTAITLVPSTTGVFAPHHLLASEATTAGGSSSVDNITRYLDDEASTLAACAGDIPGFIARIKAMHRTGESSVENALLGALLGGFWMTAAGTATGGAAVLAVHLKAAHIFRQLLERAGQVDDESGHLVGNEKSARETLRLQASLAVSRAVSVLQPLNPTTMPAVAAMVPRKIQQVQQSNAAAAAADSSVATQQQQQQSDPPFLFHVICSYAFGVAPNAALDLLCRAWGVHRTIWAGTRAVKQAARKQTAMLHSIRMKYATRLGDAEVSFLEFAMHCLLTDHVQRMAAVSVGEVRRWMVWDSFFAPLYGPLTPFLVMCGVLQQKPSQAAAANANNSNNSNSNPIGPPQVEDDRALLLLPERYRTGSLETRELPLAGATDRKVDFLHHCACEEILSAMPSRAIPMYMGDVGNLIGAWTKYNAKYQGRLGNTLSEFLLSHPERFRVLGNVVMRVTESTIQPVRVRFDDYESGSDSDGEEGGRGKQRTSKKRRIEDDTIASTGGKKKHTTRSRKKGLKAAKNRQRFDRNRKEIAQDARVPGYNKPKARKISGRGKKVNARSWKR